MSAPEASQCRVVHVNDLVPGAIYIGRENGRKRLKRSIWHNPYRVGSACPDTEGAYLSQGEAVERYESYLLASPDLMAQIPSLVDAPLACWCRNDGAEYEAPCHGDVLVKYVLIYQDRAAVGLPWPPEVL